MEKLDYLFGVLAYETPNGLTIKLKYAGEYIEEEKVKTLLTQMERILSQLLEEDKKVSEISLLDKRRIQPNSL